MILGYFFSGLNTMVKMTGRLENMKKNLKTTIAKATSGNVELNKKAVNMKKSWDEVSGILNTATRHTKKSGK